MEKKKKGNPLLRISVFGVVIVLVITLLLGLVDRNEKINEVLKLQNELNIKKNDIAEVNGLLNAKDDEIVEKYAREKLGYGAVGEKVYIDISGK